jgi:methyl-accepting chemotaxis protein
MKLQNKLVITYLLVALIPLSILVLLSYTNMRQALLGEEQRSLELIAELKIKAIQDYFSSITEEIKSSQDSLEAKIYFPVVSRLDKSNSSSVYQQAKDVLDQEMKKTITRRPEIDNVYFVNPQGKITYNQKQAVSGQAIEELLLVVGSLSFERGKESLYFNDIYLDLSDNNFDFLVSAPIYDSDKTFAGVLIFEINARKLYQIILDTEGLGDTGEVLLVKLISGLPEETNRFLSYPYDAHGQTVLFLNPLRFDQSAAFKRKIKFGEVNGFPDQEAAQGKTGAGISLDYQGKKVLAVWRYLPDRNWGIVTKISLKELLLPTTIVLKAILFFSFIAIVMIFIISWLLSRTISSPILELAEMTKKISQGDLDIKFNKKLISTPGEIGALAKGFSLMTTNLHELYHNLEAKVKERTKNLEKSEKELKETLTDAERLNKLMVGRELDMVKLKQELAKYKNHKT